MALIVLTSSAYQIIDQCRVNVLKNKSCKLCLGHRHLLMLEQYKERLKTLRVAQ